MSKQPLVEYMSPSSMMAYLTNPMYFKYRYILKNYDSERSATSIIGTAGHKALERLYSGMSVDDAILEGQRIIESTSDDIIRYNSTVNSREKLIIAYNRAINFFVSERPDFHKLISIEEPINTDADSMAYPGKKLPLPISVRLDLLTANEHREIEIVDYKFVYSYTSADVDDFKRWMQGMFYYYAVRSKYGMPPARMKFLECKTSKNKDGSAQIKPWVMEYNRPEDFATFERLFGDVILDMNNPGRLFLPNPNDTFNGQGMFEVYRQDEKIMTVDAPVAIKHRTEDAEFVDKQYVASAGSSASTENYTPEERIRKKLQEFAIAVEMRDTFVGASIIKYTMAPSRGVRMTKVMAHNKDLALALKAASVRIEAPIPGTNLIGVEVPNPARHTIGLTAKHLKPGTFNLPIGVDVYGETIYKDLTDMPHLLIAGATGSGKSVMLNVILKALTTQLDHKDMNLVLIDPKQVELAAYANDPHLMPILPDERGDPNVLYPQIVTKPIDAIRTLAYLVRVMESRYKTLASAGVRSIKEYDGNMPTIVVVVDEFADLIMSDIKPSVDSMDIKAFKSTLESMLMDSPKGMTQKVIKAALKETLSKDTPPSAEESIIRIAQKARAVGIHLILATQRPSADVVTGLIKANIPTKIAFMATSHVNSKIVLDQGGAEELTGKGDMLFADPSSVGLQRLQGLYA